MGYSPGYNGGFLKTVKIPLENFLYIFPWNSHQVTEQVFLLPLVWKELKCSLWLWWWPSIPPWCCILYKVPCSFPLIVLQWKTTTIYVSTHHEYEERSTNRPVACSANIAIFMMSLFIIFLHISVLYIVFLTFVVVVLCVNILFTGSAGSGTQKTNRKERKEKCLSANLRLVLESMQQTPMLTGCYLSNKKA